MNREKRKMIAVDKGKLRMGSIIAAFVAAVALFVAMLQMEKGLLTDYEKGKVLVAVGAIPKGQLITVENCSVYFQEAELDKAFIPDTALTNMEQVQDMAAVANIEKGVLLTTGMFEGMSDVIGDMEEPVIAGCKAEDLYQIVGGVLRAGDRVHIYSVGEEGQTELIWQNIYVQQVFDSAGGTIENGDSNSSAQRINIYLERADVEQFYSALAQGSLRVVKVCDGV